jgi:elongator complex protein 3
VRDISKQWIADGTTKTNMRQTIQTELAKEGKECKCIRCREVKELDYKEKPKLSIKTVDTLGGKELFISFVRRNKLYSLIRLRLPDKNQTMLFSELAQAAIIREVHTYGAVVPLEKKQKRKVQHKGLGKTLLTTAEEIARRENYKKIAVISAVGTRDYYRKNGYKLDGLYMSKKLSL